MPCSMAGGAAASAASWAANGVDLREPLNPTWPDEAQEITAPVGSVMDTIVLLKVLLMWACPWATFLRSLRRTFLAAAAAVRAFGGMVCVRSLRGLVVVRYLRPAFFLPATVRLGPLRVRALVRVRCPRTGRLRRWRMPWSVPLSPLRRMSAAISRGRPPSIR